MSITKEVIQEIFTDAKVMKAKLDAINLSRDAREEARKSVARVGEQIETELANSRKPPTIVVVS